MRNRLPPGPTPFDGQADRVLDHLARLLLGVSFRVASLQSGTARDVHAILILLNNHSELILAWNRNLIDPCYHPTPSSKRTHTASANITKYSDPGTALLRLRCARAGSFGAPGAGGA